MAKQLSFEFEGNRYTLGFTRETIKAMEDDGFRINTASGTMATSVPQLWEGAFLAHCPKTPKSIIDRAYEAQSDKKGLFSDLGEMITEAYETLVEEPEDESKKVTRSKNW